MTNPILKAIRNRRSIIRFETSPIEEEKIQAILEAGRWAPSWLNKQPWRFTVVKDPDIKEALSEFEANRIRAYQIFNFMLVLCPSHISLKVTILNESARKPRKRNNYSQTVTRKMNR